MSFEARFLGSRRSAIAFDDLEFVPVGGCRADLDASGTVDLQDFLAFLNAWVAGGLRGDWDGDGLIDTRDVIAYLGDWTGC